MRDRRFQVISQLRKRARMSNVPTAVCARISSSPACLWRSRTDEAANRALSKRFFLFAGAGNPNWAIVNLGVSFALRALMHTGTLPVEDKDAGTYLFGEDELAAAGKRFSPFLKKLHNKALIRCNDTFNLFSTPRQRLGRPRLRKPRRHRQRPGKQQRLDLINKKYVKLAFAPGGKASVPEPLGRNCCPGERPSPRSSRRRRSRSRRLRGSQLRKSLLPSPSTLRRV